MCVGLEVGQGAGPRGSWGWGRGTRRKEDKIQTALVNIRNWAGGGQVDVPWPSLCHPRRLAIPGSAQAPGALSSTPPVWTRP